MEIELMRSRVKLFEDRFRSCGGDTDFQLGSAVWRSTVEICERQDYTNKLLQELIHEIRVMNHASVPR